MHSQLRLYLTSASAPALPVFMPTACVLTGGSQATVDVGASTLVPTVTMGGLTVGSGTGTTLNLTATTAPADTAYGLTVGPATINGNLAVNIAANGTGAGTLTLTGASNLAAGVTINQNSGTLRVNNTVRTGDRRRRSHHQRRFGGVDDNCRNRFGSLGQRCEYRHSSQPCQYQQQQHASRRWRIECNGYQSASGRDHGHGRHGGGRRREPDRQPHRAKLLGHRRQCHQSGIGDDRTLPIPAATLWRQRVAWRLPAATRRWTSAAPACWRPAALRAVPSVAGSAGGVNLGGGTAAVPEPSSILLVVLGSLACLVPALRRKARKA